MGNKKVGILTFHRAINYGAVLQAYALKETVQGYGLDCDIIDYYCPAVEDGYYKAFTKNDRLKTKIRKIITLPIQRKRNKKFKRFIEEFLVNENSIRYTRETVKNCQNDYDYFLVGSDQVWSPLCTDGDRTYFLDFVDDRKKKNSYAVSVGLAGADFFTEEICSLINDFDNVSIREKSKAVYLENLLSKKYDKKISCCVDPVFLLDKAQWMKLVKPINMGDYVFVYSLTMPKEILAFAQALAKQKGLKLVLCTFNNITSYLHGKETVIASPIDFLSYLAGAKYVITNSFHGTAFSIVFNKQFVTVTNSNPKHDNSRLTDVLNATGLTERLRKYEDISWSNDQIDYKSVNEKLDDLVAESKQYLLDVLT